jgi:outer membrane protein OmpA-like peptidoglycan-associated protein
MQVAQMDFGRSAAYATCQPPACPAVTPKTLASAVPPVAVPPRAIGTTASLDVGEVLVPSDARPAIPSTPAAAQEVAGTAEPASEQVTVRFAFGSAVLSAAARGQIDEAVRGLGATRHVARVAISGRTDNVGPPQVNQALALNRAYAVRDHLRVRHPHLSAAVALDAEGACCFAASNQTADGRALNRRVEIVFERDAQDL